MTAFQNFAKATRQIQTQTKRSELTLRNGRMFSHEISILSTFVRRALIQFTGVQISVFRAKYIGKFADFDFSKG
jgi:hypothetical protein